MIGLAALVSRALGARERERARRLSGTALAISAIAAFAIGAAIVLPIDSILGLLGATGVAKTVAHRFLVIVMPSNVLLAVGMAYSGVLRSAGDARQSMYVTLAGAIISAMLDPILIFGFGLGTDGAAFATIGSRLTMCVVGYLGAVRKHDLVRFPSALEVIEDFPLLFAISLPAVLTNLAGPVAGWFMTAILAPFGDEAVAANAIITRLIPVAFGSVFALSGAVGPIIGQNLGARDILRVRRTLTDSLFLATIAVIAGAAYLIYRNWDTVKSWAVGMWGEVRSAFAGGVGGVMKLLINWSPLGLFYKAFAGVLSYFGVELPGKFTEYGAMLIGGLADGIKSRVNGAIDAIKEIGGSIKDKFTSMLGIKSPSRVFMGFGHNIGEGAAIGISNSVSRVRGAVGKLSGAALSGVSAASQALDGMRSGGGPAKFEMNFSPTIHVQGGGGAGVTDQVKQGLSASLPELRQMMRQLMQEEARRAYS
jgi:hypothetical protein